MKTKFIIFVWVMLWAMAPGFAQDSTIFSPEQLVDSALQKNHLLSANKKNNLIKQAEIEIIKTNYQPKISTSASFSYWRFLLPNKERLLGNTLTDVYTDVSVYQTIYDWGKNKTKKAVVEDEIKLNDEIQRQIRNTIIWGVSDTYFEALKTKSEIATYENSLRQLKSQLKYAQNLHQIGNVSRVDILKINVQISIEEKNLKKTENLFQSQLIKLKRLCYLDAEKAISLDDISKARYDKTENRIFSADSIYSDVIMRHPELGVINQQISIETRHKELYKLQNKPEIFSYGIATWEDGYIPFGNNFNYNVGVGVRYTIPLWGGSGYKSQMVQSDYRVEQIQDEKQQALQDIKQDIDVSLNTIQDIKSEIENNKKIIEMAQETLDNASVKYQAGQGSIIDILDAQEILTDATIAYHKSTIAYLQEQARLNYLAGNDNYPF